MCQVGSSLQMYLALVLPERDGEKRLQEKWCRSEKTHIQSNHTIGNVSTILLMTLSTIYFYFGKPNFKESFFSVGKDKILDLTPAIKCLNQRGPELQGLYLSRNQHDTNLTTCDTGTSKSRASGGGEPIICALACTIILYQIKRPETMSFHQSVNPACQNLTSHLLKVIVIVWHLIHVMILA